MFVQSNLPSSALVINWFTITWFSGFIIPQLTLEKNKYKTPQLWQEVECILQRKLPLKKKYSFYSWARSFANVRSAWLLQEDFPDLWFLVWTITIKVQQNTEPTEWNYWFPSAVYSITLRPILSIKRRQAIMGLRWSNWFLKTMT